MQTPIFGEPLAFGLFDQVEWAQRPASEIYDEHLALIDLADEAGFYCYHLSEHHGSPLSAHGSHSVGLAGALAHVLRSNAARRRDQ